MKFKSLKLSFRNLRYKIIHKLAFGDLIMMNLTVDEKGIIQRAENKSACFINVHSLDETKDYCYHFSDLGGCLGSFNFKFTENAYFQQTENILITSPKLYKEIMTPS